MSLIFNITHEGNNLTEWTESGGTNGGTRATTAAAAMASTNYGIAFTYANNGTNKTNYCYKNFTLIASTEYRFRFYFDPNTANTGTGYTQIASTYNSARTGDQKFGNLTYAYYDGTDYNIFTQMLDDNSAWQRAGDFGTNYAITDGPHYIEVHVKKATSASSNDGHVILYIDGTLKQDKSGLDLYDNFAVDRFYAGCGFPDEMQFFGTMYMDEFVFRNDGTEIGARRRRIVLSTI